MDKAFLFRNELEYIKSNNIKQFVIDAIQTMPDYFFHIPSSSTGKYHPDYALGEGGLYRHTRAAIRIAMELFRINWWGFTDEDEDLILASLFLHDGWKSGVTQEAYTKVEHPLIAVQQLRTTFSQNTFLAISKEQLERILLNISTHMGRWNFDYKTKQEVLPKPTDKFQKFVHLADYLASRKCLEMNFNIVINRDE